MNDALERTLARMRSAGKGRLPEMGGTESIGGNAGSQSLAVHFFYNQATGEIKWFGLPEKAPPGIQSNNARGIMLLRLDPDMFCFFVERYRLEGSPSHDAKLLVAEAVRRYNEDKSGRRAA